MTTIPTHNLAAHLAIGSSPKGQALIMVAHWATGYLLTQGLSWESGCCNISKFNNTDTNTWHVKTCRFFSKICTNDGVFSIVVSRHWIFDNNTKNIYNINYIVYHWDNWLHTGREMGWGCSSQWTSLLDFLVELGNYLQYTQFWDMVF